MLFEKMQRDCVLLSLESVPDGEGGFNNVWEPQRHFKAAIVREASNEATRQERAAQSGSHKVTADIPLFFADVFRCGGKAYKVAEDSVRAPSPATFDFWQCKASRVEVLDEE